MSGEDTLRFEHFHEHLNRLIEGHLRMKVNVGVERLLVWSVDAGESSDFPGLDFGIQAFWIAILDYLQRDVHEDLKEIEALLFVSLPCLVAIRSVRRDQRDQCDHAAAVEQAGHLAYPPHRLASVGGRESEIAIQTRSHVVAVELLDVLAVLQDEFFLERPCHG